MPCMCGDLCCPSCGPAQGNSRCPICRARASEEPCEHFDESWNLKPEFAEQVKQAIEAENAAIDEWIRDEKLAEEYMAAAQRGDTERE